MEEIPSDLENLETLLKKYEGEIGNIIITPLARAKSQCHNFLKNEKWGYSDIVLSFENIDLGRKVRPIGIQTGNVQIKLSIETDSKGNMTDSNYNFSKYLFAVKISGEAFDSKAEVFNCISSWHLDKNIPSETPEFSHPEYHLQFGGKEMIDADLDYGSLLLLESPRISHPPMDLILGIDFVLRNYFSREKIKKLIREKQYIEIRNRAIKRMYSIYYSFISKRINANNMDDSDFNKFIS
jgi:hypothetical protein